MKPTYLEQFNKLTTAYIEHKVNPFIACACFVGNMLNGDICWQYGRVLNGNGFVGYKIMPENYDKRIFSTDPLERSIKRNAGGLYTPNEICALEEMFLNTYINHYPKTEHGFCSETIDEDALFIAFEKTLDLLKEFHISKGEDVDQATVFTKRKIKQIEYENV